MFHFFDPLRVTVLPEEGKVVLSVRITDDRVDEYLLDAEVFSEMLAAFQAAPSEWSGPEELQVRVEQRLVGISMTAGPTKREVYRLELAQVEAMVAQYHAQVRG